VLCEEISNITAGWDLSSTIPQFELLAGITLITSLLGLRFHIKMTTVTVAVHILKGKDLVVKDLNSSDPFVRIYKKESDGLEDYMFQSRCKGKTLNPSFNEKYRYMADLDSTPSVVFRLFDDDAIHGEDPMGTVIVPLEIGETNQLYPVTTGSSDFFCSDAKGELQVKITVTATE
jgi:hypothetical protein